MKTTATNGIVETRAALFTLPVTVIPDSYGYSQLLTDAWDSLWLSVVESGC
jgi:hypothetical protein